jgi:hypothetical protein
VGTRLAEVAAPAGAPAVGDADADADELAESAGPLTLAIDVQGDGDAIETAPAAEAAGAG